jgi:hypothetical protein
MWNLKGGKRIWQLRKMEFDKIVILKILRLPTLL